MTCGENVLMGAQRGEVAAEVAAGVYFEERRGLVGALHRLLQVQTLPGPEPSPEVANVIMQFNNGLLSLRSNECSLLVSRLIELIGVGECHGILCMPVHKYTSLPCGTVRGQVFHITTLDKLLGMSSCRTPASSRSLEVDWPILQMRRVLRWTATLLCRQSAPFCAR